MYHSLQITPSGSNPCVICTNSVDESLQVPHSLAGPPSPLLDPRLPPVEAAIDRSAPALPSTPTSSLGSHPMITRAKAGIFRTRHLADLSILAPSGLLSDLLASTEPKGFKSAAKNPAWLAAMDEEEKPKLVHKHGHSKESETVDVDAIAI
ncbi:unnamed protein product [Fraxinus pennsylvanica]|uniref:Uncharacterized protein n=1 Tax=Fraxinus pennsylvanica TaxID=56036 RepID=A0AAD1YXG4_9LAMI|nr:unnamed protein product [Fraxinus pennsylvanica]